MQLKDPQLRLAALSALQSITREELVKRNFEDLYGLKAVMIILLKANSTADMKYEDTYLNSLSL